MKKELMTTFFYKPMSKFGVRQLSRETKLDSKTVMKYLAELRKKKLLIKHKKKGKFVWYEANRLSEIYKFEKKNQLIKRILESGVISYIESKAKPKVIVLFGSVAKGTYHEKSDIDIFVQANYKQLDLSKYEKKIGHKIQLLFEENVKTLNKGLLENIYNGQIVYGKIEVLI